MKQNQYPVITNTFALLMLVGAVAFYADSAAAAVAAGKVLFAAGQTQAIEKSGKRRNLRRGDEVYSGDRLQTGSRSRLQVNLTDGAYISVQPDSDYEIENYQFSGKEDGSEKSYFQLLKGGVRAITGLIGRKNRDSYRVNTAVATIGIRGTGHHTRMCAGDCQGKEDGLYHYTTKGITYARNDVDSKDVPRQKGVYVKSRDSLIQFFNEPPVETAAQLGEERKEEEEKKDERSQDDFFAGEQRDNETGDQEVFSTLSVSTVKPIGVNPNGGVFDDGYALVAASHDDNAMDPVDVTLGYNASFFFDPDGKPVGAILTDGLSSTRTFGTIDLRAVLGGDDPAVVSEVESLVAMADQTLVDRLAQNPASVLEFTSFDEVFWFRWGDGSLLSFNMDTGSFETVLDEFTGHQSLHVIAGPEPSTIPTIGSASYDFIGGTQSTSVSGATIGAGVTSGFLSLDFASGQGFLDMDVTHDNIDYFISGNLLVNPSENEIFDQFFNVFASTAAAGSACNPDCVVQIDGGFAGPEFTFNSELFPKYAGLEYDISETDAILGVAAFKLDDNSIQILTPQEELIASTLTGLSLDDVNPFNIFRYADVENNLVVGNLPQESSGFLDSSFGTADAVTDIGTAQNFDNFNDGILFITRWAGGTATQTLSNATGGLTNGTFPSAYSNDQSSHRVVGIPTTSVPGTGFADYDFISGSATRSTANDGLTIGNGLQSGNIQLDFGTTQAIVSVVVEHPNTLGSPFSYSLSGSIPFSAPLVGSNTTNLGAVGLGGALTASGGASNCSSSCLADFGIVFAGDESTQIGNVPAELGVVYFVNEGTINDGPGPFNGAGGFDLISTSP